MWAVWSRRNARARPDPVPWAHHSSCAPHQAALDRHRTQRPSCLPLHTWPASSLAVWDQPSPPWDGDACDLQMHRRPGCMAAKPATSRNRNPFDAAAACKFCSDLYALPAARRWSAPGAASDDGRPRAARLRRPGRWLWRAGLGRDS